MNGAMDLVILIGIVSLVFWLKNSFVYILATIPVLYYGLSLSGSATVPSSRWLFGIVIASVGIFMLYRVVVDELLPVLKRMREKR